MQLLFRRVPWHTPTLDFIVIGAQKAGTTSLWRYLEDNPAVRMPADKEAPFFSRPGSSAGLRAHQRHVFRHAPRDARLGTVTPAYMLGEPGVPVEAIAKAIREAVPRVKLIALLRDPVARARSAHRMAVRDFGERRSFADAVNAQLEPSSLARARGGPAFTDSYVVGGEYGRILSAYAERFDRDRVHVELTSDLERSPGDVVARVCRCIGVEPHDPAQLGRRFFLGGDRCVSEEAEADVHDYLARHVWPHVRHAEGRRQAFEFWFRLWNTQSAAREPAEEEPGEDETTARLRAHYAEDARVLTSELGVEPSWPV